MYGGEGWCLLLGRVVIKYVYKDRTQKNFWTCGIERNKKMVKIIYLEASLSEFVTKHSYCLGYQITNQGLFDEQVDKLA
jgi:hypothetical protein